MRGNSNSSKITISFLDRYFAYLALIPGMLILAVVIGYTLMQTIYYSFFEVALGETSGVYIGLDNYITIFTNPRFFKIIINTFIFTGGTLLLELLIALPLSIILAQKIKGINILRGIVLIPYLLTPAVVALIWRWVLNDVYGIANWLLLSMNIIEKPIVWLSTKGLTMRVLISVSAWMRIPVVTLILVGGLQTIPNELFEAAKIDGATSLKVFRFIIFPLLIPYILLSLILRTTFAIREFDLVWLLTGGGPVNTTELISSFSYKQAFSLFEAGYASALSVILLLITFCITIVYLRILEKKNI